MGKRIVLALLLIGWLLAFSACETSKNSIKIGLQAPLNGDYAYEGEGFEKAVRLLVEQTNMAGGINGQRVELIVDDDRGDPAEAALVADRMVARQVIAVIGAYNSAATEPAAAIYARANILHITPSATATHLSEKGYRQFFRVCFLDDRQGLFAANFMAQELGNTRVGVLHDGSTYASGLADWTIKYLEEQNVTVAFHGALNPDDRDFTPVLAELQAAHVESVYFTGYHVQSGLLLRQAPEIGLHIQWLLGNAANNPEIISIAGLENARGVIITSEPLPADLDYAETEKFLRDYKAKYGQEAASVWWVMAAEAYRVIEHAIRQTGSQQPKRLAEYLHKDFKDYAGISGPLVGFDEKGDRIGSLHKAYSVSDDGKIVLYPP